MTGRHLVNMSTDAERQFLCPRLIDYLAIVGARPHGSSRSNSNPPVQVRYGNACCLVDNVALSGARAAEEVSTPGPSRLSDAFRHGLLLPT